MLRRTRAAAPVLALALAWAGAGCGGRLPPPVFQPPPAAGPGPVLLPGDTGGPALTGSLSGTVVDETSRVALARARVTLLSAALPDPRVTIAGDDGTFVFERLPPGAFTVSASRSGYATRGYGERRFAPPTPIVLTEGQSVPGIEIPLPLAGVISGQVLDENGEVFAGAIVDALVTRREAEQVTLVSLATATSDDRGEFRLTGLPAGEYFVSAFDPAFSRAGDEDGPLRYTPTYYPGVAMAEQAQPVTVVPGVEPAERLVLKLHIVRPARVFGSLSTPDRRQLISGAVIMSPLYGEGLPTIPSQDVVILPDGTFAFRNVPPGRYQIRARGETEPQGVSLFATYGVVVLGNDVTDVDLVLVPGASVTGRVEVRAVRSPRPLSFPGVRVRAPFADGTSFGDAATGDIGPDGSFAIRGVMSGSHVIRLEGLPDPWVLERVEFRGQNITDTGFEARSRQEFTDVRVTITDDAAEVTGLVLDGSGSGVGYATVIAAPLAPQFWTRTSRHLRVVQTDTAGRYRIRGLPPGEYRLLASDDLDPADLHRPGIVPRVIAAGAPVTLDGPVARRIDLRLMTQPEFRQTTTR